MSGAAMRVAGLVVAVGFTLTACTGSTADPGEIATPTADLTPSGSLSPPTPTERPDAMKRDDAEGAAAAAKYFIELYPYVMVTGDTEEFEAMSHRSCGFCDDALEQAERIKERGYTYVGGDSSLSVTKTYIRDEVTGIFPLDAVISQESSLISDGDGKEIFSADAKDSESRVEMGIRDGQWVVVAVAPIPEGRP